MQDDTSQYDLIQRMKFELRILENYNLGQNHSGFHDVDFHLDSIQEMLNLFRKGESDD